MALAGLLVLGATAMAEEQQQTQPKRRKPALKPVGTAPAQTVPSQGSPPAAEKPKDKTPRDPREAGWMTVSGRIASVHSDKKMLVIQTNTNEFQVFITPVSQLTRDGKPADIKTLHVHDKVDSCHFNAKRVVQTLKVTSAEKNLTPLPNPANK